MRTVAHVLEPLVCRAGAAGGPWKVLDLHGVGGQVPRVEGGRDHIRHAHKHDAARRQHRAAAALQREAEAAAVKLGETLHLLRAHLEVARVARVEGQVVLVRGRVRGRVRVRVRVGVGVGVRVRVRVKVRVRVRVRVRG